MNAPDLSPSPRTGETAHVMVIDDDHHILEAFAKLLQLEGYAVTTYRGARECLQALDNGRAEVPDCVLCDVFMPDMDGLELQAQLARLSDLGLVLMSGASGAPEAIQAFRAGAVDFLLKPVSSDHLVQAITRAVRITQQRRQRSSRHLQISAQVAQLSGRELEVMHLVASGMTNLGMSLKLGITERTVKYHRQRVLEKLGLAGTSDLVRLVQELEQLEAQTPAVQG